MIRKHFAGVAASALAMAVTAQAFAGTVTTDGADIVVKTKGGLKEYDITRVINEVFPSEVTEYFNKYKDAYAGRQIIVLNKIP